MRELDVFPLPEGSYRKSSPYGYRTNPVTGAAGTFHRGCDYAAPSGTPLSAPFAGNVTVGYEAGGAGNWIWVVNGPDMFKSFHHSAYEVKSGFVHAGQVIAYIGTTGSSTGAHMHAELWENGRNIDPTSYLDNAPRQGAPAPTPVIPNAPVEDEDVTVIAWNDQGAFGCNGLLKRPLSGEDVNAMHFIGVKDIGHNPAYLNLLTEIPRDRLT